MKQHFMCAEQSTAQLVYMGEWKSSWCYWTWVWFTEAQCVVHVDEKQSYQSFLKNVRWLVTPFWLWWRTLLCIMSLWEQFFSQMVHHLTSPIMFVPFWIFSLGGGVWKALFEVLNMKELCDRIVRTADSISNEILNQYMVRNWISC
jgi:hypothetical protein